MLFLDVDGPLIPFGAPPRELPGGHPTYESVHAPRAADGNPLISRIDPALGPLLRELPCRLVWATTWTHDANDSVAPWLGLPPLPVVDWPDEDEEDEVSGRHWKTRTLVGTAGGRPFVWVDDEIGAADRAWVARHHPGAALLHRVEARRGLGVGDFGVLRRWLRAHG
ncbi:HAD domain-containing protein [Streptomyces sp. NPDC001941]|uniref:HAD domain-containing protein n=1 Tax=Streptomyces sp. NPDC001941 TaxID=3154659 RepID=UPI0033165F00